MGDVQNVYYVLATAAIVIGVVGKLLHTYFVTKIDSAHKRLDDHDKKIEVLDTSVKDLTVKSAVSTQQLGTIEDFLTEMREDIKKLLQRKTEG